MEHPWCFLSVCPRVALVPGLCERTACHANAHVCHSLYFDFLVTLISAAVGSPVLLDRVDVLPEGHHRCPHASRPVLPRVQAAGRHAPVRLGSSGRPVLSAPGTAPVGCGVSCACGLMDPACPPGVRVMDACPELLLALQRSAALLGDGFR